MARAIWTGSLSFGLVNVPVGIFSATDDKSIHFNQFQAGTSDRIRNKRVNERTGEEVDYSQIVKGYDVGGGEYVIVTPEEMESVEPGRSKTIDIVDFVDLDDIDPIYYQKTYYLGPTGEQAEKAYGLLFEAMRESRKVGIATFVMRAKQYLVAVRPDRAVLALETMYFADEVRDPMKEIDTLPVAAEFQDRELAAAKLLIDSMTADWQPEQYHDTYRQRVEELIERKRSGEEVLTGTVRADPAPVIDLLAALQASVEAAQGRQGSAGSATAAPAAKAARTVKKAPAARKAPAAESAAEKATPKPAARKAAAVRAKPASVTSVDEGTEAATSRSRRKAS